MRFNPLHSHQASTPMNDLPARERLEPRPISATIFVTCLVDQFKPQVGDAVVEVLDSEGVGVDVPQAQTCCGQPAFNSGFRKEARAVASRFLDVFDDPDSDAPPIVSPSGSCAAMVRNYYSVLFRDDPAELERAKRVADRLWEFTEFLVDGLGLPGGDAARPRSELTELAPRSNTPDQRPTSSDEKNAAKLPVLPPVGTYHRSCHALRELGIDRQPNELLAAMEVAEDIKLNPLERSEVCCGFGGAFSVKMPDISTAMLDEKLDNVEASGASKLIAGDTGCIMHMEGGLRRRGSDVQVLHIAELLAESVKTATKHAGQAPESQGAAL